jgi:membrane fusion protein (multidrug efflux system)
VALSVLLVLVLGGGIAGYTRWRHHQVIVDTDDACVKGRIYTVSSRIPGPLLTVEARENQEVWAGQVLATVDPGDYDAAVARARASLTEAALATNEATIARA